MLRDLERRHGARHDTTLETVRRALEFSLETGPARELTERRLHAYIDQIQRELAALSTAIEASYFGEHRLILRPRDSHDLRPARSNAED